MTKKKQNRPALSAVPAAVAFAFVFGQIHFGFMAAFFLPFLLAYFIYCGFIAIRRPLDRKVIAAKAATWACALLAVAITHWYWFVASRADANRVVSAVIGYRNRTGNYPPDDAALGIEIKPLESKWMLGYHLWHGQPSVLYAATFIIYDAYEFDFDSRTWRYFPG
jgi:predicted PurR-regulated permease PerM